MGDDDFDVAIDHIILWRGDRHALPGVPVFGLNGHAGGESEGSLGIAHQREGDSLGGLATQANVVIGSVALGKGQGHLVQHDASGVIIAHADIQDHGFGVAIAIAAPCGAVGDGGGAGAPLVHKVIIHCRDTHGSCCAPVVGGEGDLVSFYPWP